MASAILMFYTSEGFLVAADGRARCEGIVLSDRVTKIFSISEPRWSLAYAFGGTVVLTDKDDPGIILFDFRSEVLKAIESLRVCAHNDLASYANDLSAQLFNRLVMAKKNERMERFNEKHRYIAYLFFAGYFGDDPSWVTVEFLRDGQAPLYPTVNPMPLTKGYEPRVLYGSGIVAQHVFDMDDSEFAPYRVARVNVPDNVTLSEIENVATKYISACADPEAMKIDPMVCAAIGGHIHMAKVTREKGFEWIILPKSNSDLSVLV